MNSASSHSASTCRSETANPTDSSEPVKGSAGENQPLPAMASNQAVCREIQRTKPAKNVRSPGLRGRRKTTPLVLPWARSPSETSTPKAAKRFGKRMAAERAFRGQQAGQVGRAARPRPAIIPLALRMAARRRLADGRGYGVDRFGPLAVVPVDAVAAGPFGSQQCRVGTPHQRADRPTTEPGPGPS